jgi:L-lactate dehydrogenase complex protein LldG
MSSSRAEILGKIKRSLAKPALPHHCGHREIADDTEQLFRSASSRDNLVEKFRVEFQRVSGEFFRPASDEVAAQYLCELTQSGSVKTVAISAHKICQRLRLEGALKTVAPEVQILTESIDSESSLERRRLKSSLSHAQLSITGAEYLVAESGTILVISSDQASRQISLLPAIHVVLATPEQIYPNLAEVFQAIQKSSGLTLPGSALTLITGPSRTADIEKVLIKGVHGPTRIVTIMLEVSNRD